MGDALWNLLLRLWSVKLGLYSPHFRAHAPPQSGPSSPLFFSPSKQWLGTIRIFGGFSAVFFGS
jgi:hypothetical protein